MMKWVTTNSFSIHLLFSQTWWLPD